MDPDYEHEGPLSGVATAGDPFGNDIILNFCNDNTLGHWYVLILDKRPGRMSVTMFDSGGSMSRNVLEDRCSYLITFINNFRHQVRTQYHLDWPRRRYSTNQFRFIDGESVKQGNAFDCGVFSMLNAECFIRSWNHKMFSQSAMPLVRLGMIQNLYAFSAVASVPTLQL